MNFLFITFVPFHITQSHVAALVLSRNSKLVKLSKQAEIDLNIKSLHEELVFSQSLYHTVWLLRKKAIQLVNYI